jgi:hypothetical protein
VRNGLFGARPVCINGRRRRWRPVSHDALLCYNICVVSISNTSFFTEVALAYLALVSSSLMVFQNILSILRLDWLTTFSLAIIAIWIPDFGSCLAVLVRLRCYLFQMWLTAVFKK